MTNQIYISLLTPINFSFGEPGEIVSCSYLQEHGDWEISGADNCVLDRNYDLGNTKKSAKQISGMPEIHRISEHNNLVMDGGGTFRFNGYNLTDYGTVVMRGTSTTNRLIVTCDKGGCFKD